MQFFNLLDRQVVVFRRDHHVSPIGDGEFVHHEINGTAQRLKMSFMAAPARPGADMNDIFSPCAVPLISWRTS